MMQIIDYNLLKQKMKFCREAGLCLDKVCADCKYEHSFDKVSCPKCKNIMTYAINPTVDYPEYVCLVCGFNKA